MARQESLGKEPETAPQGEELAAFSAQKWSNELDSALRSTKSDVQIKSLLKMARRLKGWGLDPALTLDMTCFSSSHVEPSSDLSLANAIVLRLADAFRTSPNFLRLCIFKIFLHIAEPALSTSDSLFDPRLKDAAEESGCDSDWGILSPERLLNSSQILKRIHSVLLDSDSDSTARSLSLRVLGCMALLGKNDSRIHKSILEYLQSSNNEEAKSAWFAASCMCRVSMEFCQLILEELRLIASFRSIDESHRLISISLLSRMYHTHELANSAYELGIQILDSFPTRSFVSCTLISLTKLSVLSQATIQPQILLLLRYLKSDPRAQIQFVAMRCLRWMMKKQSFLLCPPSLLHELVDITIDYFLYPSPPLHPFLRASALRTLLSFTKSQVLLERLSKSTRITSILEKDFMNETDSTTDSVSVDALALLFQISMFDQSNFAIQNKDSVIITKAGGSVETETAKEWIKKTGESNSMIKAEGRDPLITDSEKIIDDDSKADRERQREQGDDVNEEIEIEEETRGRVRGRGRGKGRGKSRGRRKGKRMDKRTKREYGDGEDDGEEGKGGEVKCGKEEGGTERMDISEYPDETGESMKGGNRVIEILREKTRNEDGNTMRGIGDPDHATKPIDFVSSKARRLIYLILIKISQSSTKISGLGVLSENRIEYKRKRQKPIPLYSSLLYHLLKLIHVHHDLGIVCVYYFVEEMKNVIIRMKTNDAGGDVKMHSLREENTSDVNITTTVDDEDDDAKKVIDQEEMDEVRFAFGKIEKNGPKMEETKAAKEYNQINSGDEYAYFDSDSDDDTDLNEELLVYVEEIEMYDIFKLINIEGETGEEKQEKDEDVKELVLMSKSTSILTSKLIKILPSYRFNVQRKMISLLSLLKEKNTFHILFNSLDAMASPFNLSSSFLFTHNYDEYFFSPSSTPPSLSTRRKRSKSGKKEKSDAHSLESDQGLEADMSENASVKDDANNYNDDDDDDGNTMEIKVQGKIENDELLTLPFSVHECRLRQTFLTDLQNLACYLVECKNYIDLFKLCVVSCQCGFYTLTLNICTTLLDSTKSHAFYWWIKGLSLVVKSIQTIQLQLSNHVDPSVGQLDPKQLIRMDKACRNVSKEPSRLSQNDFPSSAPQRDFGLDSFTLLKTKKMMAKTIYLIQEFQKLKQSFQVSIQLLDSSIRSFSCAKERHHFELHQDYLAIRKRQIYTCSNACDFVVSFLIYTSNIHGKSIDYSSEASVSQIKLKDVQHLSIKNLLVQIMDLEWEIDYFHSSFFTADRLNFREWNFSCFLLSFLSLAFLSCFLPFFSISPSSQPMDADLDLSTERATLMNVPMESANQINENFKYSHRKPSNPSLPSLSKKIVSNFGRKCVEVLPKMYTLGRFRNLFELLQNKGDVGFSKTKEHEVSESKEKMVPGNETKLNVTNEITNEYPHEKDLDSNHYTPQLEYLCNTFYDFSFAKCLIPPSLISSFENSESNMAEKLSSLHQLMRSILTSPVPSFLFKEIPSVGFTVDVVKTGSKKGDKISIIQGENIALSFYSRISFTSKKRHSFQTMSLFICLFSSLCPTPSPINSPPLPVLHSHDSGLVQNAFEKRNYKDRKNPWEEESFGSTSMPSLTSSSTSKEDDHELHLRLSKCGLNLKESGYHLIRTARKEVGLDELGRGFGSFSLDTQDLRCGVYHLWFMADVVGDSSTIWKMASKRDAFTDVFVTEA